MAAGSPKNKKLRLQNKYDSSPEWETVFNLASTQSVYPAFAILQLGPDCNANTSAFFTDARCDFRKVGPTGSTSLYMIDFYDVFTKGFDLLLDLKGQSRELNEDKQRAVDILDDYFKEKESHEQSLSNVLGGYESTEERSQEMDELTIALAEHLLRRLAPGQSCVINKQLKVKVEEEKCQCGLDHCNSTPVFESTGIGDEAAWHGFPDIMCSSQSVAVVSGYESHVDEKEDFSEEEKTFCKTRVNSSRGAENQVISQTIVFSFIQRKLYPHLQNFLIPNLLISPYHYRILMYDSLNDILICSVKLPIFHDKDKPRRLNIASVVFLWMVLHYRLFCVGINVKEILENGSIKDIREIQSKFPDRAGEKLPLYEDCSRIGISKFPPVFEEDLPSFDNFLYGKRLFKSRRLLHALNNKQS
ncbi:uncharacterized protein LOC133180832 [Saccostrea echinata]|uniref:uncharacterized protein LOC133180832 n=1 Tax=Saccostrea echinata TaxID=191078 RepID=UPI002A7F9AEB|nr:uncharacterized protein LOC133180832 [Saccostrea echinata]